MSKNHTYENLLIVTGNYKHTGLKINLRIIGTDRIVETWESDDVEGLHPMKQL